MAAIRASEGLIDYLRALAGRCGDAGRAAELRKLARRMKTGKDAAKEKLAATVRSAKAAHDAAAQTRSRTKPVRASCRFCFTK